jgi:hypothetical protein
MRAELPQKTHSKSEVNYIGSYIKGLCNKDGLGNAENGISEANDLRDQILWNSIVECPHSDIAV